MNKETLMSRKNELQEQLDKKKAHLTSEENLSRTYDKSKYNDPNSFKNKNDYFDLLRNEIAKLQDKIDSLENETE